MVVDTTDVCLTESMLENAGIFSSQATVSTLINKGRNSFAVINTGCFAEPILNTVVLVSMLRLPSMTTVRLSDIARIVRCVLARS